MKRVLVTGGSGFIGSHVVDKLVDAGIEPRIFDLRPSPHHASGEIDTYIGDLLETAELIEALDGCDAVIHLAASADVNIVVAEPEAAERANARGTLAVLEAARATGIERVVYASTIWVYGESGEGVVDEDSALSMPNHLYTASKLAGEMYCSSYAELYDVPFTILRFGIPYGPRSRPAAVIPIFVDKALAGEPLTIAGDGMQTRRFVYVEDLARGVVAGLLSGAPNRIYNLASNETVTIRGLAETVQEAVGEAEIVFTPGRKGDFGGAEISSARADQELGWRADTPLREGVDRYVSWLEGWDEAAATALPVSDAAKREPAVVAAIAAMPAPETAPRETAGTRYPAGTRFAAVLLGVLLPIVLATRTDQVSTGEASTVFFVALIAIATALSILYADRPSPFRLTYLAPGLLVTYATLLLLPWTRHALDLSIPHVGSLALASLGAALALTVALLAEQVPAREVSTGDSRA